MYVCEEKKKDNLVGVLLGLQVLICNGIKALRLGALALMMNLSETLIRDEPACPVDFAQLLFCLLIHDEPDLVSCPLVKL